jgi:hypothetical protein
MYTQRWGDSTSSSSARIVLVHGGGHRGVCWTARADGHGGMGAVLGLDWSADGQKRRLTRRARLPCLSEKSFQMAGENFPLFHLR